MTNTLADRDQLIGQVIVNLNTVLGSLGDQSTQFAKAIDSLSRTGGDAGQSQGGHQQCRGLHQCGRRIVADLLTQARPPLQKMVHEADRTAGIVLADKDYFDNLLATLPDAYKVLSRQGLYGDFFSFYLCDLVLKVNGKGGQPVYIKVAGQDSGQVHATMKLFAERNPLIIGAIGIALTAGLVLGALNYNKLPFVNHAQQYSAYFAEAGGLLDGAAVQVSGFKVGQVRGIDPGRPAGAGQVHRRRRTSRLGDRTEAAIKTKSLLGAKFLEVTPRGDGPAQSATIPVERTTLALSASRRTRRSRRRRSAGLNTNQVSDSLQVLSDTFADTPPDLKVAVQGVARFSQTLDERDAQLRDLLANANKATGVLAERSDQVVSLIANTNALLVQLQKPERGAGPDLRQHLRGQPPAARASSPTTAAP